MPALFLKKKNLFGHLIHILCHGLSCCGARAPDTQAQQLWLTGLVAPRHVGSNQARARTRVPCIGRQILNHCATREVLPYAFRCRVGSYCPCASSPQVVMFLSQPVSLFQMTGKPCHLSVSAARCLMMLLV